MKTSMLIAVTVAAALSAPGAYADDAHHPDKKGAPAKDAKAPMAKGMPMGMMQDKMLKMHEQMHKIMQAKRSQGTRQAHAGTYANDAGAYEDDGRGAWAATPRAG